MWAGVGCGWVCVGVLGLSRPHAKGGSPICTTWCQSSQSFTPWNQHVGLSMWVWACGSEHVGLSMWVQPSMGNNDVYIYVHPWEGYGGALRHVLYCAWDHRQHLVLLATMVISRTCYPTFLLFCHRLLWAMPLKNIRKQALMWTHCWWPGLAT